MGARPTETKEVSDGQTDRHGEDRTSLVFCRLQGVACSGLKENQVFCSGLEGKQKIKKVDAACWQENRRRPEALFLEFPTKKQGEKIRSTEGHKVVDARQMLQEMLDASASRNQEKKYSTVCLLNTKGWAFFQNFPSGIQKRHHARFSLGDCSCCFVCFFGVH